MCDSVRSFRYILDLLKVTSREVLSFFLYNYYFQIFFKRGQRKKDSKKTSNRVTKMSSLAYNSINNPHSYHPTQTPSQSAQPLSISLSLLTRDTRLPPPLPFQSFLSSNSPHHARAGITGTPTSRHARNGGSSSTGSTTTM